MNTSPKQKTPFGISERRLEKIVTKAAKVIAVGFLIYIGLRLTYLIVLVGKILSWPDWLVLTLFVLSSFLTVAAIIHFVRHFLFRYWK